MSTFTFLHEIDDVVYAIRDCNSGVADAIRRGVVIQQNAKAVESNTLTPTFTMTYTVRFDGDTFTSTITVPFTVTTSQSLLPQDQTSYDGTGSPVTGGSFVNGAGFVPGEVITLSEGSLVTLVGSPAIGDFGSPEIIAGVASFLITPSGANVELNVPLIQVSSTGTGFGFSITPGAGNVVESGYDVQESTTGSNLFADKADAVASYSTSIA